MRRFYIIVIGLMFGFSSGAQEKSKYNKVDRPMVADGVIVIKFKPQESSAYTRASSAPAIEGKLGASPYELETISPVFSAFNSESNLRVSVSRLTDIDFSLFARVTFSSTLDPRKVAQELAELDNIEYAEPLYLYQSHYTPNDPELSSQTYLGAISAEGAWEVTKGSSDIVVAIVDAGVDYEHPDLSEKIYLNDDEIPDNGIDDDLDGYVDNYYGWDFAGSDYENVVQDNDPIAQLANIDHGTAVAGCAAADTDNGIGVAGMGFDARYMALKCSAENDRRDNGGAFLLNTNLAVIYAADNGADVINMSYGGSSYSQFSQDVMTYAALEKDVVLVASAGNGGVNEFNYPAAYDHVLSVANTQDTDVKATSSTFGTWVDMAAPGTQIRTTGINGTYINISGTSFSSPITAGAAALLRAHYPDYNQFQIRQLLVQTTDNIDGLNPDFAGLIGKGRLNMANALTAQTPGISLIPSGLLNDQGEIPLIGDSATIQFTLKNELSPTSSQARLTISEFTGIPISAGSNLELGVIGSGESREIDVFKFLVPDTASFNQSFLFSVNISDSETDFVESYEFELVANPLLTAASVLPYLLATGGDFESNNSGFRSGPLAGGINLWEQGVPTNTLTEVNSGTQVWKTDLDANLIKETYQCVLQSPVFDFSDEGKEYRLSFYKSMETEFCNAPAAVQLQYSLDNVTWSRVGSSADARGINWYNKSPESACPIDAGILGDQEGWLGNFTNEYTAFNTSSLAGNDNVAFRFVLSVSGGFNGDVNDDGFMIDDFQVEVLDPSASFSASKKVNYVGQLIDFEYLSNGATSYKWDFGDGITSTEKNPKHTYDEAGLYDVSLAITSASGNADSTRLGLILVLPSLSVPFALEDGGNFEVKTEDFGAENVTGSGFYLGNSTIVGKAGVSSGSAAWVLDPDSATYQDNSEAYLYGPTFDFSIIGKYELNFKANYSFEMGWDGFIVEYSTNRGGSWQKLGDKLEDSWYNTISNESAVVFDAETPIFSGTTNNTFETYSKDVSFLGGKASVAFRVVFRSDPATVDAGLSIDDFSILAPEPGDVKVNYTGELVFGSSSCAGQILSFEADVSGSVTAVEWEFGDGAVPNQASGIGPHSVEFSAGTSQVLLTVTDAAKNEIINDTTIVTEDEHIGEITVSRDGSIITLTASEGDSYQWLLEGEPIGGATSRSLIATADGEYSVEVYKGLCLGTLTFEKLTVTSIPTVFKDFEIYPNPFQSEVRLNNLPQGEEISIRVYELSGRPVLFYSIVNERDALLLDVSQLHSGVYILELKMMGETSLRRKIIKD